MMQVQKPVCTKCNFIELKNWEAWLRKAVPFWVGELLLSIGLCAGKSICDQYIVQSNIPPMLLADGDLKVPLWKARDLYSSDAPAAPHHQRKEAVPLAAGSRYALRSCRSTLYQMMARSDLGGTSPEGGWIKSCRSLPITARVASPLVLQSHTEVSARIA